MGFLVNPNIPWLGCSVDRIVPKMNTIEIKCTLEGKSKTASELADIKVTPFLEQNEQGDLSLKKSICIIVKFNLECSYVTWMCAILFFIAN